MVALNVSLGDQDNLTGVRGTTCGPGIYGLFESPSWQPLLVLGHDMFLFGDDMFLFENGMSDCLRSDCFRLEETSLLSGSRRG